jgi:hypothetical protein
VEEYEEPGPPGAEVYDTLTFGMKAEAQSYSWGNWSSWWTFTTPNLITITNPNPENESTGQELTFTWNVTIESPNGKPFSWWINCSNGQTNSNTADTNGSKTIDIVGLLNATTYRVNVTAIDDDTGYKTERWYIFTTQLGLVPPQVITLNATNITDTTVTFNGKLIEGGGETCILWFQYGYTEAFGYKTTNQSGTTGTFYTHATGFTPGNLIYYRARANNSFGTRNGSILNNLMKPNPPNNVTAETYGIAQINLSWVKGTGANNTIVERNTQQTWNRGDGTEIYNNTGTSYDDTGLTQNTLYYYQLWSWTTFDNGSFIFMQYSHNVSETSNTTDAVDPPYNGSSNVYPSTVTCNLTWERGNYSDQEVVVGKTTGYPTSPTDGTVYQNNTNLYYNFSITQTIYFTIFSYNSTHTFYSSTGLEIPWGALRLNVFNASKPWQPVSPFGLIIQNQDGDETYINPSVSPPLYLDINDIPFGDDTMFILNATRYVSPSTYTRDTVINHFHNFTFLMVPHETGTPGEGDPDPDTEEPTNQTSSQDYVIIVQDSLGQYVGGALVKIEQYNNYTDTYDEVGSGLTSDGGGFSISLVPGVMYRVTVSKNGYVTSSNNYCIPDRIVFGDERYYTIILELEEIDPYTGDIPSDYISFCTISSRTNTTLYLNFTDQIGGILDAQVRVYEFNSTNVKTLFYSNSSITSSNWSLVINGLEANNSYQVILWYNHSVFGGQKNTCLYEGYKRTLTTPEHVNIIFTSIFGVNPLVWSHVIMFCFMVAGFFYADQKDAGKVLIILGGFFIFLNIIIGIDDALLVVAGGIIPAVFILVGILLEWLNHQRGKAS